MRVYFYCVVISLHTRANTSFKIILPHEVDNIEYCKLQNYGIQENGF